MRKRASHWPTDRSLFRTPAKRKRLIVWVTVALAVACTVVFVALSRVPPI